VEPDSLSEPFKPMAPVVAEPTALMKILNPPKEELPDDFTMPVWDHLAELRERVLLGALAATLAILTCFFFSKDLVVFLEAPVISQV
jgi:sec-independent protein translocase protein TatC